MSRQAFALRDGHFDGGESSQLRRLGGGRPAGPSDRPVDVVPHPLPGGVQHGARAVRRGGERQRVGELERRAAGEVALRQRPRLALGPDRRLPDAQRLLADRAQPEEVVLVEPLDAVAVGRQRAGRGRADGAAARPAALRRADRRARPAVREVTPGGAVPTVDWGHTDETLTPAQRNRRKNK